MIKHDETLIEQGSDSSEFKVGDYVLRNDGFPNVIQIKKIDFDVVECIRYVDGEPRWSSFKSNELRHATPSEIKAGHRIDKQLESDDVKDITNHISPNTKVVEL